MTTSEEGYGNKGVRFWTCGENLRMTTFMKDFGRLQAYANPSNAGTRGPHAVGYGDFGFLLLGDMRDA